MRDLDFAAGRWIIWLPREFVGTVDLSKFTAAVALCALLAPGAESSALRHGLTGDPRGEVDTE